MAEKVRGGTLVDWRLALEAVGDPMAKQLDESPDPYSDLQALGMPAPAYAAFDQVGDFLDNSEPTISMLRAQGAESFYVGLRPTVLNKLKFRELGLEPSDIAPYITSKIARTDYDKYRLRIAEHAIASYGAVMIINRSGLIHLEMVKGEMMELATGAQTPEYTVRSDKFTGVMHYSFEDTVLRSAVWRAVSCIPRVDQIDSFRPLLLPGYYEFSLTGQNNALRPVFYDVKQNPLYTIPE